MFCPRCGQQQATDALRFCSRCGFPLDGALHLLAHGGMLPQYRPPQGDQKISPRRRGVKQGALLMLIGAVLVPLMGVFTAFAPGRLDVMFEFFLALTAIICFVGGPLRMLFAAIFEEGAPSRQFITPSYATPAVSPPARAAVLPPQSAHPASQSAPRPQTAEVFQ